MQKRVVGFFSLAANSTNLQLGAKGGQSLHLSHDGAIIVVIIYWSFDLYIQGNFAAMVFVS